MPGKICTCLWFENNNGLEAAEFYTSLIPNSAVGDLFQPDPASAPIVVNFTLGGVPYQILNGGPYQSLSPSVSISVETKDQAETDQLWDALLADGGKEMACGWLTDRFGLCWQIVPECLPRFLTDDDREAASRTHEAMMQMVKLDVAELERAFAGG